MLLCPCCCWMSGSPKGGKLLRNLQPLVISPLLVCLCKRKQTTSHHFVARHHSLLAITQPASREQH